MKFTYPPEARPLDGFTIKRAIYRGGFGEVYYAVSDAGREVALKLLQNNAEVELRGVQQCLNLSHPNLVTIFDVKTDAEGDHWILMEFVAGDTLDVAIRKHPAGMPVEMVRKWLPGLTAGVSFLHSRGIVHRDLKPANIFMENGVVKIGDVGLSKFITPSRRSAQTQSVGTVYYMAPEIAKGRYGKEVDVYATGVILFEMLTGQVPFDGESTGEILMKHLTEQPDLTKLPPRLRNVIARSLQKDPDKRYRSLDELKVAFDNAVLGRPELDHDVEFLPPGKAAADQVAGAPPGRAASLEDKMKRAVRDFERRTTDRFEADLTNLKTVQWTIGGTFLFLMFLALATGPWAVVYVLLFACALYLVYPRLVPFVTSDAIHQAAKVAPAAAAKVQDTAARARPNWPVLFAIVGGIAGFLGLAMQGDLIGFFADPDDWMLPAGFAFVGMLGGMFTKSLFTETPVMWMRPTIIGGILGPVATYVLLALDRHSFDPKRVLRRDDDLAILVVGMVAGVAAGYFSRKFWSRPPALASYGLNPPAPPVRQVAHPAASPWAVTPARNTSSILGSLFAASPICTALVAVLVGFMPSHFQTVAEPHHMDASLIGMFAAVTLLGTWGVTLIAGMFPTKGKLHLSSRWHYALMGAVLGASAWGLSEFLLVGPLQESSIRMFRHDGRAMFRQLGDHALYVQGVGPSLAGYIAFFTSMFFIRDWSHVINPRRKRRLSISVVLWTVMAAWFATLIFPFPREWAVAWATLIACSSQLANPIIPERQPGSGLAGPPRA